MQFSIDHHARPQPPVAAGLELRLPRSFQHESTNPVDGEVKTLRKLVIYRGVCRERFRCLRATHLSLSPGSYDVSVHCVQSFRGSQLWRECVRVAISSNPVFTHHIRRLPPHGSSPSRSCPRLVLQLSGNIWHTASFSIPVLRTGDWSSFGRLHPTRLHPCWAYRSTGAAVGRGI